MKDSFIGRHGYVRALPRSLLLLGLAMSPVVACFGADGALDPPPLPAEPRGPETGGVMASAAAAPFDLGAVIQRVHFAYRAEGDAFMWSAAARRRL